jgi:hypothetical protein
MPETTPSSFNDAEKIENFLNIGDSCEFAAKYLEDELLTALDPTTDPGGNLSKAKRTSLCSNLKIIIKALTVAHDLSYKSSSRISHIRQQKRAHDKCKREAKRQRKEMLRRLVLKNTQEDKHFSIPLLEEFHSKAYASLSSDSSSGDDSAGEDDESYGPAPVSQHQTRSVTSAPGWMKRLPPLQPGYTQYSPKDVIDFVISEIENIDKARESGEKGVKAMVSDLKEAKNYLFDEKRIPCTVKNLERVIRHFKDNGIYPS